MELDITIEFITFMDALLNTGVIRTTQKQRCAFFAVMAMLV